MTKSFDEWFKGEIPNSHKKVGKEKIETFVYETAQDAWNFKQAEVDELQKRIDKVLIAIGSDYFVDVRVDYSHQIIDIRKILKGDSHES